MQTSIFDQPLDPKLTRKALVVAATVSVEAADLRETARLEAMPAILEFLETLTVVPDFAPDPQHAATLLTEFTPMTIVIDPENVQRAVDALEAEIERFNTAVDELNNAITAAEDSGGEAVENRRDIAKHAQRLLACAEGYGGRASALLPFTD